MLQMLQFRGSRSAASASPIQAIFDGGAYGCWYDYSDDALVWQESARSTPAGNGDPIGGVTDKSGNAAHAYQGTSGYRPTRTSGRAVGNGSTTWLQTDLSYSATPYLYVFCVVTLPSSLVTNQRLVSATNTTGNDYSTVAEAIPILAINSSTMGAYRVGNKGTRPASVSTEYLMASFFDSVNSRFSLNGGTEGSSGSTGDFTFSKLMQLAGNTTVTPASHMAASIAEIVVIVGTALTSEQETAVIDDLMTRHGL